MYQDNLKSSQPHEVRVYTTAFHTQLNMLHVQITVTWMLNVKRKTNEGPSMYPFIHSGTCALLRDFRKVDDITPECSMPYIKKCNACFIHSA